MKFKFLKYVYISLILSFSGIANAGLINDIEVEKVNYNVSVAGYSWTASYDILFSNQDLIIDVDIYLSGSDAGQALKDIWEDGIESLWSNTFDIFDGDYYYDTIFNVDWLTSATDADHTVVVHQGDGHVNLVDWYTGNPSGWGYGKQGTIAAHEFGHMIGLADEYAGGATSFIRPDSIMGQNLTSPQTDHFDAFTGWLNINSGINTLSLVADSGMHNYSIDVPEPSTFAIFLLGIMGLASRQFKKN